MAKKPVKKDASSPKASKGPALFAMLSYLGLTSCLVSVTALFAGIYDLGFMDLTSSAPMIAMPALATFVIGSSIAIFASSKAGSASTAQNQEAMATNSAKFEGRVDLVEKKIEAYLGEEYNKLKSENEEFKTEIQKKKDSESENLRVEVEKLRTVNEELREELSKRPLISDDPMISAA